MDSGSNGIMKDLPSLIVTIEADVRRSSEVNVEPGRGVAVQVTVAVPKLPPLTIEKDRVSNPESGSCTVRESESVE